MSRLVLSAAALVLAMAAVLYVDRVVRAQDPYNSFGSAGMAAGGTATGQVVVNVDPASTATNQASLFINMPASAAATDKALAIKTNDTTDRFSVDNSGAVDVPGTMGNSGTATCGGIGAGSICINDNDGVTFAMNQGTLFRIQEGAYTILSLTTSYSATTISQYPTRPISFTGAPVFVPALGVSSTTIAAISANQNNWSICDTVGHCRVSTSGGATYTVTGIAAPTTRQYKTICNVASTGTITFTHDDASSTAANRFYLPGAASKNMGPYSCVEFFYDTTASRWWLTAGPT